MERFNPNQLSTKGIPLISQRRLICTQELYNLITLQQK